MWPDSKKHSRNVYAHTREECEALLPGLIAEMKEAIAAIPDGISKKKNILWNYMIAHPEVTNKSSIARAVGVDQSTVHRHYNDIRKKLLP